MSKEWMELAQETGKEWWIHLNDPDKDDYDAIAERDKKLQDTISVQGFEKTTGDYQRMNTKLREIMSAGEQKDNFTELTKHTTNPQVTIQEAGRTSECHFKLYCLANGISEEEMLQLTQENPPQEIVDKIKSKLPGFYNMCLKDDHDEIVNYYTEIALLAEKKLPDIAALGDLEHGMEKMHDLFVLYSGAQSYIGQSLCLGNTEMPEKTMKLLPELDSRLKEKGKSFNFMQAFTPFELLDNVSQVFIDAELDDPEMIEYLSPRVKNAMVGVSFSMNLLVYDPKGQGGPDKVLGAIDVSKEGWNLRNQRISDFKSGDFAQDILCSSTPYKPFPYAGELAETMKGNVHTFMGIKRPSKEYKAMYDDLEKIDQLEKQIADARKAGNMEQEIKLTEQTRAAYEQLKEHTSYYMEHKNPDSETQANRYALAIEANHLAVANIKKLDLHEKREKMMIAKAANPTPLAGYQEKQQVHEAPKDGGIKLEGNGDKIGPQSGLKAYIQALSNDMVSGSGFTLEKFAHCQAAVMLTMHAENNYKNEPISSFELLAEGIAEQPAVKALAEKYTGKQIPSVKELVNEMNAAKTKKALKNKKEEPKKTKTVEVTERRIAV